MKNTPLFLDIINDLEHCNIFLREKQFITKKIKTMQGFAALNRIPYEK